MKPYAIVLFLIGLLLEACSSFSSQTAPGPIIVEGPPPPAAREPGSLWADDSRWNSIYDAAPFRAMGDTVKIAATDSFPVRLAELKGQPADSKSSGTKSTKGPKQFDATISEILPRGTYRLWVSGVRVEEGDTPTLLTALVREKDIRSGDVADFDALFNVKVEGKAPEPKKPVEKAKVAKAGAK